MGNNKLLYKWAKKIGEDPTEGLEFMIVFLALLKAAESACGKLNGKNKHLTAKKKLSSKKS